MPGSQYNHHAPSSTSVRRQRLLGIGSSSNQLADSENVPLDTEESLPPAQPESTPLRHNNASSYGTLPNPSRSNPSRSRSAFNFRSRRGLPELAGLTFAPVTAESAPTSPLYSATGFRDLARLRLGGERPISAYDQPSNDKDEEDADGDVGIDTKINGIRVWYSSFSSIDWLHDAIKDSARFSRLRGRRSMRSRFRLMLDRSMGWIIVSLVGFLTAVTAFLVVRSEQLLFDSKEGYCTTGWWKAERYCCPERLDDDFAEETCAAWRTWSQVFTGNGKHEHPLVQGSAYTVTALILAVTSCLLTLYLTDCTTFNTRKESGVLAPDFRTAEHDNAKPSNGETARPASISEFKRQVMYYAAGSGIPEIKTILSGFVIHGYLGGRTLFTKSVGLALSVASGLSLGKEGPFVHIASCIGNIVSRFHSKYENNEGKRREILSAACAAGVAVAFGAPIGGTLFSLEEVSYFFPPKVMWRSFFCAMIATLTLRALNPFGTGKLVLFQVSYDKDWHAYELLGFVALGVFGGVYGAYFSKLNYRWSLHVRNGTWLKSHPIMEVALVTLATCILCFLNPYTRMGGTELIAALFSECRKGTPDIHGLCVLDQGSVAHAWPVVQAVGIAMLVKGLLTIVTFGIKVPAGIFIPTLGVGACAGRILGIFMQWLQAKYPSSPLFEVCNGDMDCVIPGLYAMVGAAATLSGVTRTTVSLAVIMFELTDTLTYSVPVMIAILVAKTVADALEPKGIYDLVIGLSQLPYLDTKHEYLWGNLLLDDVTNREVDTIRLDKKNTVKSLRDQLQNLLRTEDDGGFPILQPDANHDGYRLVGYIGLNELEHALSIVAEDGEEEVLFQTAYTHPIAAASFSSLMSAENTALHDPFDFSPYMDQAPLTLQINSPLELLHQFFVKLGARYIVLTDNEGLYEGVVDKKTWLAFLSDLEEKS